ncbi:MAG: hypothetical protein ACRD3B_05055 [Candidatus Sulfotelmatobacter sp.]
MENKTRVKTKAEKTIIPAGDTIHHRVTQERGVVVRIVNGADLPQPILPSPQSDDLAYIVAIPADVRSRVREALWWESDVERCAAPEVPLAAEEHGSTD